MSDHDALLAAILAEPAEDMPRLLLAEWLDENAGTVECRCQKNIWYGTRWRNGKNSPAKCPTCSGTGRVSDGRAERAEFIRVQCELARWTDGNERFCDSLRQSGLTENGKKRFPELAAMLRRERELLEKSYACEIYLGFDGGPWTDFVWSRGFISSLTLTWAAWREHADAILRAQPVERVRLTDRPDSIALRQVFREKAENLRLTRDEIDDRILHDRRDADNYDEYLLALLKACWPRITFELPEQVTAQPRDEFLDRVIDVSNLINNVVAERNPRGGVPR